jgi:adenylosuccinate lyase
LTDAPADASSANVRRRPCVEPKERAAQQTQTKSKQLEVNRDAMRQNLERTRGFIMAQRVTFALAPMLGKDEADDLVRGIIKQATEKRIAFRPALLGDPVVSKLLSPAEIDELLKPDGYLGLAKDEVDAVIAHVEALRKTDPAP